MPEFIDITKNPEKAISKMNSAQEKILGAMKDTMEKALLIIEADAKRECPADTGRLRSSITHTIIASGGTFRGRVGTNVTYAPFVHEGTGIYATNGNGRQTPWVYKDRKGLRHFTHGIKPKPFLRIAVEKNRYRISNMFAEAVKDIGK